MIFENVFLASENTNVNETKLAGQGSDENARKKKISVPGDHNQAFIAHIKWQWLQFSSVAPCVHNPLSILHFSMILAQELHTSKCSCLTLLKFHLLFSSVQSLSRVQLFATPGTAAHQSPLTITNSLSLLKLMSSSQ